MNIVVTGLRGFPDIQGGVETHCEQLYPRIAAIGGNITVVRRKGFIKENPVRKEYKKVKFKDIYAPKITGFEAAIHTLSGVFYAFRAKADIIHIHAIGPAIAVPFAKLLGLKVVVTHHGPDYDREKWGKISRTILKLGEYFAAKYADKIIVISTVIRDILKTKYNRTANVHLIYNGVPTPPANTSTNYLNEINIKPFNYILAVGRFVKEKRFDFLIEAYLKLKSNYKLVIAGDSDYQSAYSDSLKNLADRNQVILTGMVKGDKLHELYSHAALFVLPSSHEGLPITLLEAMSFQCKVLASNIPANMAVGLPEQHYFDLNSLDDLCSKMNCLLANDKHIPLKYDLKPYNWDNIAKETLDVYNEIVK